ncbi:MAG: hypothetical protein Q9224_005223, partial [Gallowayella concinna]
TQITKPGGAVVVSAAIQCLAENMTAKSLAMKVFVELAKSMLIPTATVGRRRDLYLVATEMKKEPAKCLRAMILDQVHAKSGWDHSSAATYVTKNTIAANTDAKSTATRKMLRRHIALDLRTSSTIVHVVRPCWMTYPGFEDKAVRIQSQIATSSV